MKLKLIFPFFKKFTKKKKEMYWFLKWHESHLLLLLLLLSRFSCVRLCATPWTAAYQVPLSMGFSRQEYWSGLPLPSPVTAQWYTNSTYCYGGKTPFNDTWRQSTNPTKGTHAVDHRTAMTRASEGTGDGRWMGKLQPRGLRGIWIHDD